METRSRQTQFSNEGNKLAGYAIVWDSPTTITERGRTFNEIVRRGAIHLQPDVIATFNHDPSRLLGRLSSGTLRLSQDDIGVRFEVDLPDSAHDIRELVARGDLKGASFTFSVRPNGEKWNGSTRELTALDVYELGPVTCAAYPTTSVGLRSRINMSKVKLKLMERK
jgi:HK97 family phage prohead protease